MYLGNLLMMMIIIITIFVFHLFFFFSFTGHERFRRNLYKPTDPFGATDVWRSCHNMIWYLFGMRERESETQRLVNLQVAVFLWRLAMRGEPSTKKRNETKHIAVGASKAFLVFSHISRICWQWISAPKHGCFFCLSVFFRTLIRVS